MTTTPLVIPTPNGPLASARRRARSALWLAVAMLALSGCGATTTTTPVVPPAQAAAPGKVPAGRSTPSNLPSPKAAPRSTLITDVAYHFSVRLPAGYERFTQARFNASLKAGGAANPQLKPVIDQFMSVRAQARVFAYKLGDDGVSASVSILAVPAGGKTSSSFGRTFREAKPVLERFGTITGHRVEKLAGTKAMRIEYRMTTSAQRVRGTQVNFFHRGKAFVITISQPDVPASSAEANAILRSLRLT